MHVLWSRYLSTNCPKYNLHCADFETMCELNYIEWYSNLTPFSIHEAWGFSNILMIFCVTAYP